MQKEQQRWTAASRRTPRLPVTFDWVGLHGSRLDRSQRPQSKQRKFSRHSNTVTTCRVVALFDPVGKVRLYGQRDHPPNTDKRKAWLIALMIEEAQAGCVL